MTDGRSPSGFTRVELAAFVFVVGVLAAFLVPVLRRNALEARSTAVAGDLRGYAVAFKAYAREHGDWPQGGTAPGTVPPGMEPYLKATGWNRATPIGGLYQWDAHSRQAGETYAAVIVLASTSANPVSSDSNQLHDIDRRLDDGRLGSGIFFLGYRNYPVFVLEH